MKRSILIPVLFCGSLAAQAPELKPDTLIATIDGQKLTYGDLTSYLDALGPEKKAQALANPRQLLNEYALQKRLVEIAKQDKLDQMSPYKEALELARRQILFEAELNYKSLHLLVTGADQKKFYDANQARYTEVKLQVIYLAFTSDEVAKENPKKYRSEAMARALAQKIRSEVKKPEDWVRLVKQYSEDETSKANDGLFGTVKMSDTVPSADVKKIIFALKAGEISEPVLQQNGFYLFRAQSVGLRTYESAKDEIYTELKDVGLRAWVTETQKKIDLKIENQQFLATPPAPKAQ